MRIEVKEGQKYGYLSVIKEAPRDRLPSGQINRMITCKCVCGVVKDYRLVHLNHGKTKSCGCVSKVKNGKSNTAHGILLNSMQWRCSPDYPERHLYYDKGITVYDGWVNNIDLFIDWCNANGYKKGLTIDRIDNDKGYYPENCRFVSQKVNANNRDVTFRVVYNGKTRSLQMLLKELNYPNKYYTVRTRILRGWPVNKAIHQPPGKNYSGRL